MNLYRVTDYDYSWVAFTFADTAGKAKNIVANEFNLKFLDMRCRIEKKDVSGEAGICDADNEKDCERLAQYGLKYDEVES